MTRSVALALLGALALGCRGPAVAAHPQRLVAPAPDDEASAQPSSLPPDAPPAPGLHALEGFLAKGDRRPAVQTLRFDVDALPVATWAPPTQGTGFRVSKIPDGWRLWVRTHVFAEVVVATAPHSGAKVLFTAFTGGSFAQGDVPTCGKAGSPPLLALWSGFSPEGWTNDGVNVEMGTGDLDLATCAATPRRSLNGRASALVFGYVYALRVRDEDDESQPDKLVLFLPRGALVSTSADPTMPIDASNTGSFTRLTFPLVRGTARSAVVRISPAALALWSSLRRTGSPVWSFDDKSPPHEDLQLEVDVSWQDEVKLATVALAVPAGKSRSPYAGLFAGARSVAKP